MQRERKEEIEALFDGALDRAPGARRAWLREAAADAALLAEVEALLAAHERAEGVLDRAAADIAGQLAEPEPADGPDPTTRVGPWRLVREIGRGGMGRVHLAERDDAQFHQEAAVKLLRAGLDSDDYRRRFLAERQILASLQHPNIGRLLDGGVTEDGRPYFVMEYVPGEPIDVYCDRRGLTVDERLRLFCTVARAVQHAHGSLVVHRDLKPSNILVTADGTPKLLDVGIAKMLDPGAASVAAPATRTGMLLMTPEYAAPEQVADQPVTVATDVYALGLVLYELLCGRRAQPVGGRPFLEMQRAILREEPPRPSAVVRRTRTTGGTPTDDGPTTDDVARARAMRADRLARKLVGDIDRIVLTAIRKEPERRYHSAEALAEDIERYLAGKAVRATGDSTAYRMRKFVRRHRWAAAGAAAFVLLLAGYATTVTVQSRALRREREEARLQAQKADTVTAFLMNLFEAGDPSLARGDTVTARELLQRGYERADRLGSQPLVQAEMFEVIGRVYQSIANYPGAQQAYARALEIRRRHLGPSHPDVAEATSLLGRALNQQGKDEEAEQHLQRSLAMYRELYGERHLLVAADLNELSSIKAGRGDWEAAEAQLREALQIRRALLPPDHEDIAESLYGLAWHTRRKGRLDEAEALDRQVIAMRRKALGDDHPEVARALNALGGTLFNKGEYAKAVAVHEEALALNRRLYGTAHTQIALSLSNLAVARARSGDLDGAERALRETIAMRRAIFGPEHKDVAMAIHNHAVILGRQKRYAESERALREATAIRKRVLGADHPEVAWGYDALGGIYVDTKRWDEAERAYFEALTIHRKAHGPDHPNLAEGYRGLGDIARARRDWAKAEEYLRIALKIGREKLGDRHADTQRSVESLLALYEAMGRRGDAAALRPMLTRQ